MSFRIGIDVGGTFTDFVLLDTRTGRLRIHKSLTTPKDPSVAALVGLEELCRAAGIGRDAGLRYVYEGNVPGEKGENTYCYRCKALLVERYGYRVRRNRISKGCCPDCRAKIDGVGMSGG